MIAIPGKMLRGRSQALPRPGLVANWDLYGGSGQTAADKSGSNNTLQLGSSAGSDGADPTWTATGLTLNGSQYCVSAYTPASPLTLVWVANRTNTSAAHTYLGTSSGSHSAIVRGASGGTGLQVFADASDSNITVAGGAPAGSTVCGAVVLNGVNISGYLSGVFVSTSAASHAINAAPGVVQLGTWSGNDKFLGTFYHALVYARALNASDIAQLYRYLKGLWAGRGVTVA